MKITGNRGEWSELYVLIRLLSLGKLYAADENVKRIDSIFFPIIKIFKDDWKDHHNDNEYVIHNDKSSVEVNRRFKICKYGKDGKLVATYNIDHLDDISQGLLNSYADYILKCIQTNSKKQGAFEIDKSEEIMEKLKCIKICASNTEKADIVMLIHDIFTGYEPICGFSIKSELGSAPTLFNPSKATNFIYEVSNLTDDQMLEINKINTPHKIIDRMNRIYDYGGRLSFRKISNEEFTGNLMLIDSHMPELLGELIVRHYHNGIIKCSDLVKKLEEDNPLKYPRDGMYEYKMKKLLCSIALGMQPAKKWDGHDEANGGYIIVTYTGDVVAYHIYNRDAFETYLLNNTKLDRPSTTRFDYASIYQSSIGKKYIKLNLQIRFI